MVKVGNCNRKRIVKNSLGLLKCHPVSFQELLDFPPAPKLTIYGKLDPKKANPSEMKGQEIFFGKAQCAVCHPAPYYTDNLMHNLKTERFYKPRMINGRMAAMDGPIKTFALRGIKDSPPYLHDDRLLTLEDTVEFFNLVQGLNLTEQEKKDLVSFLSTLEDRRPHWAAAETRLAPSSCVKICL
jgi:cytochrome c peroxidase